MDLSFGQWIKLGFGAAGLMQKHAAAIPVLRPLLNDAFDLWQSVVPPTHEPPVPVAEVVEKLRTGEMNEQERAHFDRETQGGVG